ncbi:MAG: Gfo/Idh/MocA family oxidoreductase, partial [Bdellovibrionota bacterium]
AKAGIEKLKVLASKLQVGPKVKFFPMAQDNQEEYLKIAKETKNLVAIVAVPDHLHFKITNDLLDLGIATMVVKPFTTTLSDAITLAKKAQEKKLFGAVEFHKRFDEANILLKDALTDNKIGDLLYVLVEYSQKRMIPLEVFKEWSAKTNIFQYLGVHYVDLIYHMTGARPVRVSATGQKNLLLSQGIDTYDSIQANILWENQNGKTFNSVLLTNWIDSNKTSSMSDQKIKVIGTSGRIESDQKNRGLQMVDAEGIEDINPYFSKAFKQKDGYYIDGYGPKSIRQFINDCKKRTSSYTATFADAVISASVTEAVGESLRSNNEWIEIKHNLIKDFINVQ